VESDDDVDDDEKRTVLGSLVKDVLNNLRDFELLQEEEEKS
jgi:hypothetical protein